MTALCTTHSMTQHFYNFIYSLMCIGIVAVPDKKVIKEQSSADCKFQRTELKASHYLPQQFLEVFSYLLHPQSPNEVY
jgi:hypothetical protein